jgi:hypothetical protein
LIIHVFFTFFTPSMPTAVFGLAVVLFTFEGLPVSLLGLSVVLSSCRSTTQITAVCLPPEATPAQIEKTPTPPTLNFK